MSADGGREISIRFVFDEAGSRISEEIAVPGTIIIVPPGLHVIVVAIISKIT